MHSKTISFSCIYYLYKIYYLVLEDALLIYITMFTHRVVNMDSQFEDIFTFRFVGQQTNGE